MTDLSEFQIEAVDAEILPQLPPTPADMGWLIKVKSVDAHKSPKDTGRSLTFACEIQSESDWGGYTGIIRHFLDGQWPANSRKKIGRFAHALGLEGEVNDTQKFIGKMAIVEMDSAKDPKYTTVTRSWLNNPENRSRITMQPLPGFQGQPPPRLENAKPRASGEPESRLDDTPF